MTQFLINTLVPATLFGLVAASFTIVHRVTKVLHLAHGGVVLVGAYSYFAALAAGWGALGALVAAMVAAVCCGMLCALLAYEPLRAFHQLSSIGNLIASLALLLVIEAGLLIVFGSRTRAADPLLPIERFTIAGGATTNHQVLTVTVGIILIGALMVFLRFSRLGRAMRAVADHEEVAAVVGIAPRRVRLWTYGIASALAGIAGALLAGEHAFEPHLSIMVTIKAFTRSLIGGVGSVGGAFAGSLLTDLAENTWAVVGATSFREVATLALVMLVLLLRPQGLFGRKQL